MIPQLEQKKLVSIHQLRQLLLRIMQYIIQQPLFIVDIIKGQAQQQQLIIIQQMFHLYLRQHQPQFLDEQREDGELILQYQTEPTQ